MLTSWQGWKASSWCLKETICWHILQKDVKNIQINADELLWAFCKNKNLRYFRKCFVNVVSGLGKIFRTRATQPVDQMDRSKDRVQLTNIKTQAERNLISPPSHRGAQNLLGQKHQDTHIAQQQKHQQNPHRDLNSGSLLSGSTKIGSKTKGKMIYISNEMHFQFLFTKKKRKSLIQRKNVKTPRCRRWSPSPSSLWHSSALAELRIAAAGLVVAQRWNRSIDFSYRKWPINTISIRFTSFTKHLMTMFLLSWQKHFMISWSCW